MTPVLTQDGRQFQRRRGPTGTYHSQKDCRARPSTYSPAVNIEDGRLARPSIPTQPGTDGTIRRQGPAVRTGRLGTLVATLEGVPSLEARVTTLEGAPSLEVRVTTLEGVPSLEARVITLEGAPSLEGRLAALERGTIPQERVQDLEKGFGRVPILEGQVGKLGEGVGEVPLLGGRVAAVEATLRPVPALQPRVLVLEEAMITLRTEHADRIARLEGSTRTITALASEVDNLHKIALGGGRSGPGAGGGNEGQREGRSGDLGEPSSGVGGWSGPSGGQ